MDEIWKHQQAALSSRSLNWKPSALSRQMVLIKAQAHEPSHPTRLEAKRRLRAELILQYRFLGHVLSNPEFSPCVDFPMGHALKIRNSSYAVHVIVPSKMRT